MGKHLRRIILSVLSLLAITCCALFVACSDPRDDGTDGPGQVVEPKEYSITVNDGYGATVSADRTKAKEGDTVTLTVETNYGYSLTAVKLNGTALTVTAGTATFKMPGADAEITAETAISQDCANEPAPGGDFELSSTIAGNAATSYWSATYGDEALTLDVYVQDSRVTVDKDGIEVYFGLQGYNYAKLTDKNRGVKVTADGNFVLYEVSGNDYATCDENGINVSAVKPWTKDGSKIDGYYVRVEVTYASLGLSEKPADGTITALPVLSNYTRTLGTTTYGGGYSVLNAGAYYYVKADAAWEENEFAEGVGVLGKLPNIPMGEYWDISEDYNPNDTENYPNRNIVLDNHDNNDNNIVFKPTKNKSAYVEATFRATRVIGTEKWGKFGLMFFDGSHLQSGLFYYVDAYVGDAGDGVIRGKNLGYNDGIGGWGGWNGVPGGENKFDLATKTITLGMSYHNEVVSLYYINGDNDTLLMQYVHVANGDYAIGIKTFAIGLEVSNYTVVTDTTSQQFIDHTPDIVRQDLDTLFAGDSYMDFWKLYGLWDTLTCDMTVPEGETTRPAKLANRGIGGTQVPLWSSEGMLKTLKLSYNPKQIAFHIGVNDIDSPATPDVVYGRLQDMFTKYHTAFPNAQIFWVSLIPNNFYINNGGTYNANYKTLNARVKTLADGLDYVTYIDMETPFTDENGNARTNLFMDDGLHLNPVYGYPLWTSIIKNALGYTSKATGTLGDLGEMTTDGYSRKATLGWTHGGNDYIAEIKNDVVYGKTVNTEEVTYFNGAPSADILFEADLRSPDRFYPDNNSKPGVALVNDDITIFAYLQTLNDQWQNNGRTVQWYGLLYRNNKTNDAGKVTGVADWNWSTISQYDKQLDNAINICADFHKLGIAKIGTTLYLLLDGNVIREYQNFPGITADMKFSGAVMTFNRYMQVKSARAITGAENIRYELAPSYTITVPEYYGTTITLDGDITKAKKGDKVAFAVNVIESVTVDHVYVTYGNEDHELTLDEGKYRFDMPEENVSIKISFSGQFDVTLGEGVAEKLTASSLSILPGGTVTFTAKDNVYIAKLFANGTEITTKDTQGNFTLVVTEEVNITGEFYGMYDGVILDGVLDDAYGAVYTETRLSENRNMQVWAKKTESGVLIYAMSHSNEFKNDGGDGTVIDWYNNSNFEFYLNDGVQRCVNSRNFSSQVTAFFTSYEKINNDSHQYNGKWENIYEIFVAKEAIPDFDKGNVQVNFAFKTGNGIDLAGFASDYVVHGSIHQNWDWWSYSGIGGCCADFYTSHKTQGRVKNLFATTEGTLIVRQEAKNGMIDGNLQEFADKGVIHTGNNKTAADISAYVADDGLYVGIKLLHDAWSVVDHSNWSINDNFEIVIDDDPTRNAIVFMNGRLIKHSSWSQGTVVAGADENGKKVHYIELFMPTKPGTTQVKFQSGLAGNGFGGWQELIWGGYYVNVTSNGIAPVDVDGKFDDDVWNADVKNKSFTTTANGANISVMGVKTGMGVMLGVTVTHSVEIDSRCQGKDDSEHDNWYYYMGPEIRLFGQDGTGLQVTCTAHNKYKQFLYFGTTTENNGNGTFTTTYEMFIPYYFYSQYSTLGDTSGDIGISLAGVYETGWTLLFGSTNWSVTHKITSSGMIAA